MSEELKEKVEQKLILSKGTWAREYVPGTPWFLITAFVLDMVALGYVLTNIGGK